MLNPSLVSPQISSLASHLQGQAQERDTRLRTALDTFAKAQAKTIQERHAEARGRVTWLVADLPDGLTGRTSPPPPPHDYLALAADGSSVEGDRHAPAHCYLINIGTVLLRYDSQPEAKLESHPRLYVKEDELSLKDPKGTREELMEGNLLAAKRMLDEMEALLAMARATSPGTPAVALMDGSLILWGLTGQAYPDFVREELVDKGVIRVLEGFRQLALSRQIAVGAYISMPRSTDVVNALRLALCPFQPADCDKHCGAKPLYHRECDGVAGVLDRELFEAILAPGERSPLYASRSSIVLKHYGGHQVYFFYVNIGDEIARVEVPQWVAQDASSLGLIHSAILDQCRKGRGYPEVLAEAHEQAVIHPQEQQLFWRMVEDSLGSRGVTSQASEKSQAKRRRWA